MNWVWNPDEGKIVSLGDGPAATLVRPAMDRDQNYKPAFIVLHEADFAVAFSLSRVRSMPVDPNGTGYSVLPDGRLVVAPGSITAAHILFPFRNAPPVKRFETLAQQRRYLLALSQVIAILPQEAILPPNVPPRGKGIVVRMPVFENDFWSPYSQFLLDDPDA